jgi:hypothetical protein
MWRKRRMEERRGGWKTKKRGKAKSVQRQEGREVLYRVSLPWWVKIAARSSSSSSSSR